MVPVLLLAWGRLRRMAVRFTRLAAQAGAGALPKPRPAKPRPAKPRPGRPRPAAPQLLDCQGPAAGRAQPPPPVRLRLPSGRYWLIRLVPEANGLASQLQRLLADPELAALLEAAPQAGRILRPLCRMLAIRPAPPLAPPPKSASKPQPPQPARAATPGKASHVPRRYGPKPPSARIALRRLRDLAGIPPPPGPRWRPA